MEQKINQTYTFPEVAVRLVDLPSWQLQEPIDNTEKATSYMRTLLANCTIENLAVVTVDSRIRPINYSIISRGTVDQAFYSPSEIIRIAILSNAAGLIAYHNHPSGDCSPSHMDDIVAENMSKCLGLFHITFHDFIIIGSNTHYSYHSEKRGPFQNPSECSEQAAADS